MERPRAKGAFFRDLDLATRPFRGTSAPPADASRVRLAQVLAQAAEALILSDSVYFKVLGENIGLAALTEAMGANTVESLLEERAISFVLWKPMIGLVESDSAPPESLPITAGTHTLSEYVDPEASADSGLRGWSTLGQRVVKRIARKAAENTIVLSEDLADQAVERVVQAYDVGDLQTFGITDLELAKTTPASRKQLSALAVQLLEAAAVVSADINVFEAAPTWEALTKLCKHLRWRDDVVEISQQTIHHESVPSITQLITSGALSLNELTAIRDRQETRDYRRWLWETAHTATDAADMKAAYDALIMAESKKRGGAKVTRLTVNAVVSTIIGAVISALTGGNVPLGIIASGVAAEAQNAADGFWIDRLLRERNPRRYATDVLRPYAVTLEEAKLLRNFPGVKLPSRRGATATGAMRFRLVKPLAYEVSIPVGAKITMAE